MIKFKPAIIFLLGVVTGILIHGLFYLGFSLTYIGFILLFFVSVGVGIFALNINKKLEKADEEIRYISSTDEVTRVYHRKFFFNLFEKELNRAVRYKRKFSCIMIDLDSFKKINDTYGWQMGDRILRNVANILKDSLRDSDIIGRYGNDQFICVLPETETEPALIIAKRLVALLGRGDYQLDTTKKPIKITASIGVTAWQPSEEKQFDAVSMIGMAEKAVLLAKKEGGNRVDCYII